MTHRFLLDNDGSNLFYNLTNDVECERRNGKTRTAFNPLVRV